MIELSIYFENKLWDFSIMIMCETEFFFDESIHDTDTFKIAEFALECPNIHFLTR